VYRECTAKKAARNGLLCPPMFTRTFRRSSTSLPSDFRKSHHACKMHLLDPAMAERSLFSLELSRTFNNLQVADGCVSPSKYVQVYAIVGCIMGCEMLSKRHSATRRVGQAVRSNQDLVAHC
jgi:hypothetical protein